MGQKLPLKERFLDWLYGAPIKREWAYIEKGGTVHRIERKSFLKKFMHYKLWVFLICGAIPCTASAKPLSSIISSCRVLATDSSSARQRFDDSELTAFVNEGQKDCVTQIWPIRKASTFELIAGSTYYSTPSDFLHVLRVTRDYQVITEKSPSALDKVSNWQEVGGLPINYYLSFSSRSLIGFYPFPDSTASTATIRMDYVALASDLSASSDEPYNAIVELQPYAQILEFYCAYRATLIDGAPDLAQAYYAEYQRGLKRMSEEATARPAYNPSLTGAGSGYSPKP